MGFLSEWGDALQSVVMVAQVWECTGNYRLSHFKKMNFMVFEYLKIRNSEKPWLPWHLATLYPNTLLQVLGYSRFYKAIKLFLGVNSNTVFLANRHFPTCSDKIYWSSLGVVLFVDINFMSRSDKPLKYLKLKISSHVSTLGPIYLCYYLWVSCNFINSEVGFTWRK